MFKRVIFALLVAGLYAEDKIPTDITPETTMSAGETIFWYGVVTGGTAVMIMCIPMVLFTGIVLPIKATIATAKIVATGAMVKSGAVVPLAGKINMAAIGVQLAKNFVLVTPKQKLDVRVKEEVNELLKTKRELENCLMQHNADLERNFLNIPTACEEVAMLYALCQQ